MGLCLIALVGVSACSITEMGNEAEPHDRADLGTYAEGPSAFGFFSGLGFRYFRRSCFDIGFAEGVIFRVCGIGIHNRAHFLTAITILSLKIVGCCSFCRADHSTIHTVLMRNGRQL